MTKIHKRGRYSAALKEKVSLEALKGEKTLQQIASENLTVPIKTPLSVRDSGVLQAPFFFIPQCCFFS